MEQCCSFQLIHDELCVHVRNKQEHGNNLLEGYAVSTANGLVLTVNNTKLNVPRSLGPYSVQRGWNPTQKKSGNIWNAAPANVHQFWLCLGMTNFMQTYIPWLSHHTAPLPKLLKHKKTLFWDDNTNAAFLKLKNSPLRHQIHPFDITSEDLPVNIWKNASKHIIVSCILQKGNLTAFALSFIKIRYTNIEWDLSSVVITCEHFHTYQ